MPRQWRRTMVRFPRPIIRVGECLAVAEQDRQGRCAGVPHILTRSKTWYKDERWYSHRLSYHLNKKKIPRLCKSQTKGFVLHTCDNSWCIEPEHLYLGDRRQNSVDLYERHPTIHASRKKYKPTPETRKRMSVSQRRRRINEASAP